MNENFTDRFDSFSGQGHAQDLSARPGESVEADVSDGDRVARRRRTQRLALLGFSIITLFSLVGMIITRAMEIASL